MKICDMTIDELMSLLKQLEVVVVSERCYLSDKQEQWALDLIDHAKNQNISKIGDNAVNFMTRVVRGDYSDTE